MERPPTQPDFLPMSVNKSIVLRILAISLCLLAAACGSSGLGGSEPTTPAPEAVFTSAAQTAEARRVERFAQTATIPPESMIATSAFATSTFTAAPTSIPTFQISPTAATASSSQVAAGGDRGEFVADVSIPDGTVFAPNQTFQKTWRLANAGQTTWTTDYSLVYIDGDLMGAEPSIPLPNSVGPGERIEITVDMVAPPDPGSYRGFWKLRNSSGEVFGFGANANEAIWVDILVQSALASGSENITPAAAGAVSTISLAVDNAQVSGGCPHTFVFTAQISMSQSATLSYILEAGTTSGTDIRQPPPTTQTLGPGIHPVVYELTVPANVTAWARLHVTQPVQAFSNQVDFSLICG